MFVKNNEARVHKIGAAKGGTDLVLLPGVNEIEPAAWAEAKKIVVVQALLKAKLLEEVAKGSASSTSHPPASPAHPSPAVSLFDLKAEEAENLIAETYDRELLGKWKKVENRKTVLGAIDAQLDLVKIEADADKAKK